MVDIASPATPDRGHIVWLTFDPQAGHEQPGRRPGLVLSDAPYNRATGLFLVCPVTSRPKGYLSEVPLPGGMPVTGVVLADQVRNMDWVARRAVYVCDAPPQVAVAVVERIKLLWGV